MTAKSRLLTRRSVFAGCAAAMLLLGVDAALSEEGGPWLHVDPGQGLLDVYDPDPYDEAALVRTGYWGQMYAELEFPEYDDGGLCFYLEIDGEPVWSTTLWSTHETGLGADPPARPWHEFSVLHNVAVGPGEHWAYYLVDPVGQVNTDPVFENTIYFTVE